MSEMAGLPPQYQDLTNDFLTPLLAGTVLNAFLYGIGACGQWRYWHSYRRDHWLLRTCVAICLLTDTLNVISVISMFHEYAVTGFGNFRMMEEQNWQWPAMVITTGISALVSQGFLVYRVHRFTKGFWVTIPLLVLTLAAFGESIWVSTLVTKFTQARGKQNLANALTGWAAVTSTINLILCAAVVVFLFRMKDLQFVHTRHLVRRLMIIALYTSTGLVLLEVGCLITYLVATDTNAPTALLMTLGRAYTLVLLVNLNQRSTDKPSEVSTVQSGASFCRSDGGGRVGNLPAFLNVELPDLGAVESQSDTRRGSDQSAIQPTKEELENRF